HQRVQERQSCHIEGQVHAELRIILTVRHLIKEQQDLFPAVHGGGTSKETNQSWSTDNNQSADRFKLCVVLLTVTTKLAAEILGPVFIGQVKCQPGDDPHGGTGNNK